MCRDTRRRRAAGVPILLLLAALACGAPQRAGTAPEAAPPRAAPPPPAQPAPAAGAAPTAIPVRGITLGVSSLSASNIVQYVGMDYGLYEQDGFKVIIQQLRSSIMPAAMASNQVDYSTGVDSALRLAATGVPIKVVAVNKRAPTFAIMARPEITGLQDLRGKVVGTVSVAGSNHFALKRTLDAHGMSLRDVNTLVLGDSPVVLQNLLQGLVDGAVLSAPHVFRAQDEGYRSLVYVPDHVSFATTGLTVSDEALATRREEIKRLIATQVRILEFIKANRDKAIDSLARHFDLSRDIAARTYDFEAPALTTDPRLTPQDLDATIQEEIELGHLTERVPYERMAAMDVTEEALTLLRERAGRP